MATSASPVILAAAAAENDDGDDQMIQAAKCTTLNNAVAVSFSPSKSTNSLKLLKKNSSKGPPPKSHLKIKMMSNLEKRPPVDIEFKELSYSVHDSKSKAFIAKAFNKENGAKKILKGVGGKFKSGELAAIMGPSGAGKSTLMNIISGYKTSNVTGDININDKPRNLRKFRKLSCYIMQDDALSPHLTVREAMKLAADLKLGENISKEKKKMIIEEIAENIGLSECMETRSNMISGGKRRFFAPV